MNIIIHIGLPKTGTTTLQHYLTKTGMESGYIGKFSGGQAGREINLLSEFRQSSPVAPNSGVDEIKLSQWVSEAKQYISNNGIENLIISDERLSSRGGGLHDRWPVGPVTLNYEMGVDRPFPEFVTKLRKLWDLGEVKVVVTVRNQPEWIASLYAQRSYRIRKASQKDFEREVGEIIKKRGDFLEWNVLVKELQDVLADGMLKVLFFEDINQPFFWSELSEFAGLNPLDLAPVNSAKKNVNAIGGMKWKIKERAAPDCSFMAMGSPFTSKYWVRDFKKCVRKCSVFMENFLAVTGVGREKEFVLKESVRSRLLDRYELSNQELARLVRRDDLSVLRYLKGTS